MDATQDAPSWQHADDAHLEFLHELGSRIAAADPLHDVLNRVVEFATSIVRCDACLIFVLQNEKLVLRASKIPHAGLVDNLDLQLGQGITGWVAENREPVAIAKNAAADTRFKAFKDLPEDRFEAFIRQRLEAGATDLHAEAHLHFDRVLLPIVLRHTKGSQQQAAKLLGIARQTLRARLRELDLNVSTLVGQTQPAAEPSEASGNP